jgi:hypothetical protein
MNLIGSMCLRVSGAIFSLEVRLNRFRQGRAENSPDFANGFHKVSDLIKALTACFRGQPEAAEPKPELDSWQHKPEEPEDLEQLFRKISPRAEDLAAAAKLAEAAGNEAREEDLAEHHRQWPPYAETVELLPPPKEPEAAPDPTEAPEFQDWGAPPTAPAAAPADVALQHEIALSETSDREERALNEAILENVEKSIALLLAARADQPERPGQVITDTPQPVSMEASQAQPTPPPKKERPHAAKLKKTKNCQDVLEKSRKKKLKQGLKQGSDPSPALAMKPLKLAGERSRELRQTPAPLVKREHFRKERKPPPSAAPVERPPATKSELQKQKAANKLVDAWEKKDPGKFAAHIGSSQHFSVLKGARKAGHAHLHQAAKELIKQFKEMPGDMDWQQKAGDVLSAEITALQEAKSKDLLKDLKALASHFETYQQSDAPNKLADSDLEDLRALGKLITDLQKTANEPSTSLELRNAALLAFRRDLNRNNPHDYLQDKHEGAGLARLAMQQGLQDQAALVVKALAEVATEHKSHVATISNCSFSKMTQKQSEAACLLTTAFLNKAYDLENDGAALRFHPDMLAYLDGAAGVILRRRGDENEKRDEVREFFADAVVVLPLEDAFDKIRRDSPTTAGMAKIVTGLAAWLFRESERPPAGVSLEAVRDLQFFIDHHRTAARSVLHRMLPD